MTTYRSTALALVLLVAGCWNSVEAHCRDCVIVHDRAPALPPISPSTKAIVILVHGAFGFGDEWKPLVDELRTKRRTQTIAFGWGGPWTRKPTLAAEALRRLVQAAVDERDVVVIAHSAGGALARYVAARLRVPPGRRVKIASIAGARDLNVAPYHAERAVNTPLGFAVGGKQDPIGPIAAGVDYVEYDPPGVGHNASVAYAGLPLVRALR